MYKLLVFLILLLGVKNVIFSQNYFDKMDSISKVISEFQSKVDGLKYKDVNGDYYEVSFTEQNFKIWSYNRLASKAVYKKDDKKEILALTDNIDLSLVESIERIYSINNVSYIKLYFPPGHLKTQIYENGQLVNIKDEDFLEFFEIEKTEYSIENPTQVSWDNFHTIVNACHEIKLANNIISDSEYTFYERELNRLFPEKLNDLPVLNKFIIDYKSKMSRPVYYNQIKLYYEHKYGELLKVRSYIDSVSNIIKFKIGMTESEFRKYNPAANMYLEWNNRKEDYSNEYYFIFTMFNTIKEGPNFIKFNIANGKAYHYVHTIEHNSKNDAMTTKVFGDISKDITSKIPPQFSKWYSDINGLPHIFIFHPNISYFLEIEVDNVSGLNKWDKDTYIKYTISADPIDLGLLKKGIMNGVKLIDF